MANDISCALWLLVSVELVKYSHMSADVSINRAEWSESCC